MDKKIAVIGAGISGCCCARMLADKGYYVDLFERSTIGGTARTFPNGVDTGVHVLYFTTQEQKEFFTRFCDFNVHEYYVRQAKGLIAPNAFVSSHYNDFPPSELSLYDYGNEIKINNDNNLKSFFVNKYGDEIYQNQLRFYNEKQWGQSTCTLQSGAFINRPFSPQESPSSMFKGKEAGYPRGGYTQLLAKMIDHKNINYINKEFNDLRSNAYESIFNSDSILPVDFLPFINIQILYYEFDSADIIPTYLTTFPNAYKFTRICNYFKQGNVLEKNRYIYGFEFPNHDITDNPKKEIEKFMKINNCNGKLVDRIFLNNVYPIPDKRYDIIYNDYIKHYIDMYANVYPIGRQGLYAYISMARAYEIARDMIVAWENNYTYDQKINLINELRKNAW